MWRELWRPASVYSHNRARFHLFVFTLRALLWLIAAIFAWDRVDDGVLWIGCGVLVVLAIWLKRRPHVLEILNQGLIIVDFVLITVAVRLSGGLHSQIYILYGAEALFLTAYGTVGYSVFGALAWTVSYAMATTAWDVRLFWWRIVVMGVYFLAAGGLGREYRLTRTQNRENRLKLQQLSQLRAIQDSIVEEQDIDVVITRLLGQARELTQTDAAYVVRVDHARRAMRVVGSGFSLPDGTALSSCPVPQGFHVYTEPEMRKSADPQAQFLVSQGMRSAAVIPLRYEDSLYGWMTLASRREASHLQAQEFIIQSLADVLSTQFRFHEQQTVASKRGQLLAILERVGRIVSRNLEMEQLLRSLRTAVAEVLETDSFFVALTLPHDPDHVLMQYLWDDGEEYPTEVFPIDPEGLTGSVIITGEPLLKNGEDTPGVLAGSKKSPRGMIFVPLQHEGRVLGAMSAQSYRIEYGPDDLEFLSAIASQASIAIRNAQMYEQTQEIALTDYLTGLGNSRRLNLVLQSAIEVAEESSQPLSLLVIDSDSLKSINDRLGHRAGDLHLQRLAQVIRDNIRDEDMAFRYAGDEFVVILPKSTIDEAMTVGERIRHEIETRRFEWGNALTLGSTISVGVASYKPGMTADELFQAADRAMYAAKQSGKNRVAQGR
ncbi:MAG: sensor domain-containing diguanylate cyclase [Firmicutes bacterium]|nr:sensor domain-containing diguanylate cyclase [Bacillota bacterium]